MVNFVILAVFIHKGRKKDPSPVAPRKGRVQYVTDDGFGHLPEHIRREIAQPSTSPSSSPTPSVDNTEIERIREERRRQKELDRRRKEFDARQLASKKKRR